MNSDKLKEIKLLVSKRIEKMNSDQSLKYLKKDFRLLWFLLDIIGIRIFMQEDKGKLIIEVIRKYFFASLLHAFIIINFWLINYGKLGYVKILDSILNIIPIALWWVMFRRKIFLGSLLQQIFELCVQKADNINPPIFFKKIFMIVYVIYIPILATVRVLCSFEMTAMSVSIEIWQLIQKSLLHSLICLTYCVICMKILQSLKTFKAMALELDKIFSSDKLEYLAKRILAVEKCLDFFQNVFSLPSLLLVATNFFAMALFVLDVMVENSASHLRIICLVMDFTQPTYFLFLMIEYAAKIPMEMEEIKTIILDQTVFNYDFFVSNRCEKMVGVLTKRKVTELSAYNIFSFKRGFLLQVIAAAVANSIIYHQISNENNRQC